jgi:alpha-beta hydrolase superfamily lysophospholipase
VTGAEVLPEVHATFGEEGSQIFVREWPLTEPRFILVIAHGGGEHSDYWTTVARTLGERLGATAASADFPGHGRSDGARVEVTDVQVLIDTVDLVVEQQRAKAPGLPVVLLGHSMGGLASARYAQQHGWKLAAVVLHAAAAIPESEWNTEAVAMTLEEMTPDPILQQVILNDPFRVDQDLPEVTVASMRRAAEQAMNDDPLGSLPLIWLHGQEDRMIPIQGGRIGFSQLRADKGVFLSYPGVGHGGILESTSPQIMEDLESALALLVPEVVRG